MTAAILQADLASLITDSKRKDNDVRVAAEKTLSDLKAIAVTSEAQLAGDILRRPHFIKPFVLACNSGNSKLAVTGTTCIQRLVASKAVPPDRIHDVLDAFQSVVNSGVDVQLKILQTLPSLLSLYASTLHDRRLAKVFEICASLQNVKASSVRNTAAATFQQLLTSVFGYDEALSDKPSSNDPAGQSVTRSETAEQDATAILVDLCASVNQEHVSFIAIENLPLTFVLDALISLLGNYGDLLHGSSERRIACETMLLPGLLKIIQDKVAFGVHVRSLRILFLLLDTDTIATCDAMLDLVVAVANSVERDAGPLWKRVSSLELVRAVCTNFDFLCTLIRAFDMREGTKQPVVPLILASLVKISSEDPLLIGLGRKSTMPQHNNEEVASIEDGGLGTGGSVITAEAHIVGVSLKWSTMTPICLDQPERLNPPDVPSTYLYALALSCIVAIADGLSKTVMPLSMLSRDTAGTTTDVASNSETSGLTNAEGRSQFPSSLSRSHKLINPLTLHEHPEYHKVLACAELINSGWPAILATCSTFLNAALDSHFYHILVRSVQKLAQISGMLELKTPRDAFLTTLAKSTLPSNVSTIIESMHVHKGDDGTSVDQASPPPTSTPTKSRRPLVVPTESLNIRHLLCLRALLHLAIALGPKLEREAWFIVFEVLQQVEVLLSMTVGGRATFAKATGGDGEDNSEEQGSFRSEINAVRTASRRLLESTRTYSDYSFKAMVSALLQLQRSSSVEDGTDGGNPSLSSPTITSLTQPSPQPKRSMSIVLKKASNTDTEVEFVLAKISELAQIHTHRLCESTSRAYSWDTLFGAILDILSDTAVSAPLRLQAVIMVNSTCIKVVQTSNDQKHDLENTREIETMALKVLKQQIDIVDHQSSGEDLSEDVTSSILRGILQAVESIVGHCGEHLTDDSWRIVFGLLNSALSAQIKETREAYHARPETVLHESIPPAFRVVQLIMSDFLDALTPESLTGLTQILQEFASQYQDLNIALTTSTLFWNLISSLAERCEAIDFVSVQATDSETAIEHRSISDQWMAAVQRLSTLCLDSRHEVRTAALRVLTKALEASSTRLSARSWTLVIQNVFLKTIQIYTMRSEADETQKDDWQSSICQMTEAMSTVLASNVVTILTSPAFSDTWRQMLSTFINVLEGSGLDTQTAIFSSLSRLVEAMHEHGGVDATSSQPLLALWFKCHPLLLKNDAIATTVPVQTKSNQECMLMYVRLFLTVSNAGQKSLFNYRDEDVKNAADLATSISRALQKAVFSCSHPLYSTDVKTPSAEQEAVLSAMNVMQELMLDNGLIAEGIYPAFVADTISQAMHHGRVVSETHPSEVSRTKTQQAPTYIAFVNKCISILSDLIKKHGEEPEFRQLISADKTLTCLGELLHRRRKSTSTSNDSLLWRPTITACVELLEALSYQILHQKSSQMAELRSVHIIDQIIAEILDVPDQKLEPSESPSPEDEQFVLDMLIRYHRAACALLSRFGTKVQHKRYILTLFYASLIAKPWYSDLPPDLMEKPLQSLLTIRPGTVCEPVLLSRDIKSYAAFDALLELVREDTSEAVFSHAMRCTAAPYVLLRVAHSLKVFLADQPLRGLTPMPMPLQVELSTLMEKYLDMKCFDSAFSDLMRPGSTADCKTHLRLLQPLMLKVKTLWRHLPRLGGRGTWQEEDPGKRIDGCLTRWEELTTENWGIVME